MADHVGALTLAAHRKESHVQISPSPPPSSRGPRAGASFMAACPLSTLHLIDTLPNRPESRPGPGIASCFVTDPTMLPSGRLRSNTKSYVYSTCMSVDRRRGQIQSDLWIHCAIWPPSFLTRKCEIPEMLRGSSITFKGQSPQTLI